MTEFFHLYTDGELKMLKEYTQLVQKIYLLEQQLQEANKLIKWVVKTSWTGNQEEDDFDRYLEKWGVK